MIFKFDETIWPAKRAGVFLYMTDSVLQNALKWFQASIICKSVQVNLQLRIT